MWNIFGHPKRWAEIGFLGYSNIGGGGGGGLLPDSTVLYLYCHFLSGLYQNEETCRFVLIADGRRRPAIKTKSWRMVIDDIEGTEPKGRKSTNFNFKFLQLFFIK